MKKVFMALMAVAAIALTGCKQNEDPTNAALEYATLCDKLIKLPVSGVESEMTKAGWVQVEEETYVKKDKKSAYENAMKDRSDVKKIIAIGVVITVDFNKEGLCYESMADYMFDNPKDLKPAVVSFSEHAYNNGLNVEHYIAEIDREKCADHAAFIDGVKNKEWKQANESMLKKGNETFDAAGQRAEENGQVAYAALYIHAINE